MKKNALMLMSFVALMVSSCVQDPIQELELSQTSIPQLNEGNGIHSACGDIEFISPSTFYRSGEVNDLSIKVTARDLNDGSFCSEFDGSHLVELTENGSVLDSFAHRQMQGGILTMDFRIYYNPFVSSPRLKVKVYNIDGSDWLEREINVEYPNIKVVPSLPGTNEQLSNFPIEIKWDKHFFHSGHPNSGYAVNSSVTVQFKKANGQVFFTENVSNAGAAFPYTGDVSYTRNMPLGAEGEDVYVTVSGTDRSMDTPMFYVKNSSRPNPGITPQ